MKSRAENPEAARSKKRYRSPEIHVYGDIRAITRTVGQNNNKKGQRNGINERAIVSGGPST